MYVTVRGTPGAGTPKAPGRARVSRVVVMLGLVSLLTDVSSESVTAVLPLYITVVLGLSPLAYGVVDALYVGVSAAVRLLGGWLSDRVDRPKWVAFTGYALSAVSRIALLPGAGYAAVVGVVTADRLGKGIRTAPRDALITSSSDPAHLGRSFGVHRSMDTIGAMLGPLLAFGVLAAVPLGFDLVFVLSFAIAVIGVIVLGLLVPDLRREPPAAGAPAATRPRIADLWVPGFRSLLLAAAVLGLVTVGDGFLYLALQRRDGFAAQWFPLLFVGTSVTYLLLAIPMGRLADRIGRGKVFVAGHVALLVTYVLASGPFGGAAVTIGALLMLGTYYAATDGVLAAIAGRMAPPALRASGIAAAQTVAVLARACASLVFGLVWTYAGRDTAVLVFAAGLIAAIPLAALVLRSVSASQSRTEVAA